MQIGLFFGSFNPIHIGHLLIAQYLLNETNLQQVWMVVSPHNPLKEKSTLAKDYNRLHLVRLATEDNPRIKVSDIEFSLPKPSYTVDTLEHLKEKYPEHQFSLIMGGDNLVSLNKWKNYEIILRDYPILVYKRSVPAAQWQGSQKAKISYLDVPLLDISSTRIREMLKQGKSIQYMVPDKVYEEIITLNMYKA